MTVIDSGCTKSVDAQVWLDYYLQSLSNETQQSERKRVKLHLGMEKRGKKSTGFLVKSSSLIVEKASFIRFTTKYFITSKRRLKFDIAVFQKREEEHKIIYSKISLCYSNKIVCLFDWEKQELSITDEFNIKEIRKIVSITVLF